MKYAILGFVLMIVISCGETRKDFNKATLYSGTVQILRKKDNVVIYDESYDIRVKLSNNAFYRVDEDGGKTCFGDVDWSNNKVTFSSSECACLCDCNPNIDCAGDFILGDYDIIFESEDRLELEFRENLSSVSSSYDETIKKIVLEKE